MKNFVRVVFYGNIFYGICAVALCIETNLFHHVTLNIFPFYLLIFFCSWIYYTMIYVRSTGAKNYNERTLWYRTNAIIIKQLLRFILLLVATFILYLFWKNRLAFKSFTIFQWLMIVAFPFAAALYTFKIPGFYFKKIRQIGWLKPFVVGFTWSGWVTVYPLLVWQVQRGDATKSPALPSLLFWLQNFLFISILAIIFDVKDYRTDVRLHLNTYPAKLGIKKTFHYVVYPATCINIAVFLLLQSRHHFTINQTLVQGIPYMLLVIVVLTHRSPAHLLYYLVAIDGLMFLKAICGIISISFL